MQIRAFHEAGSSTFTYVLHEGRGGAAVVIDPVLDFAPDGGAGPALRALLGFLAEERLDLSAILETHPHADHVTAASLLREAYPEAEYAIGEGVVAVQRTFAGRLPFAPGFFADGRQFDRLLRHGDVIQAGDMALRVLATPGHTPACVSYATGKHVFTGDALFMPDFGTGRCDFPAGSAEVLYDSITRVLYGLDDATEVLVGHDYGPGGRPVAYRSSVAAEKAGNVHVRAGTTREEFVRFRTARDATLAPPKLMVPSLLANLAGGDLGQLSDEARRTLLPIAS